MLRNQRLRSGQVCGVGWALTVARCPPAFGLEWELVSASHALVDEIHHIAAQYPPCIPCVHWFSKIGCHDKLNPVSQMVDIHGINSDW